MEIPDQQAILSVNKLQKRFGEFIAVDDVSFSISRGEIFGFLGPNGAGKTTTINMICGLSPPSGGSILINGKKITEQPDIRTRIGICPQENILWTKLTCREQLVFMGAMYGLGRKQTQKRASGLLDLLGLSEKVNAKASTLSGGMKKRLNLCLSLMHDPDLLVLDEPEAGLDPQSRILVREFIQSLAGTKTIILTTHNMDEADRLSNRVAIIDHGKLLMVDSPSNLKKTVGEGDVLEVRLEENRDLQVQDLKTQLEKIADQVNFLDSSFTMKSKNLVGSIAAITETINSTGNRIREMTLRENTLEDVFIHLTGRKLRS